ncbi:isoprenylcysteine carboxylmethyltransferase family protein [bacterium]|nr:isoprenylcysteine carboxylmethyltransferase family protein [bacterium]
MIRIFLFIICSIFFVSFSRRALANPSAHGFYRFFVFEAILILILLNQPYWFVEPFRPMQLLSWLLLGCSIFMIIQSFSTLKRLGGQADRVEMPENHLFENTAKMVEDGLYRYIRHPMYSSLLFLGWGAFLKHITLLNIVLIFLLSMFVFIVARVEERENVHFFGPAYASYMQRTKLFIPHLL